MCDPGRPVVSGSLCFDGVVGIRPYAERAELVGPAEQCRQPLVVDVGVHGVDLTGVHAACGPVDGDPVAFVHLRGADGEGPQRHVDLDLGGTDDRWLAELAGDERSMTGPAAARSEDARRGQHAVDVVGLGLLAHQHDLTPLAGPSLGEVGVEGGHADRGTR